MGKSIFREIIIILLLIIVIILLLGILFYDYIPSSKEIPSKVEEYALAEDVKQELEKELQDIDSEKIIKTYQIDATELKNYENKKEYDKGKVNPFAKTSEDNNNADTNNIDNNTNNNVNNNTNTFFNTIGK